jgi:diacylglycerol kinase
MEFLIGVYNFLNDLKPWLLLILGVVSALAVIWGILRINASSIGQTVRAYFSEGRSKAEIAKEAAGAGGVQAIIVAIPMWGIALVVVGAGIIYGLAFLVIEAIGRFVPGVTPPAGF